MNVVVAEDDDRKTSLTGFMLVLILYIAEHSPHIRRHIETHKCHNDAHHLGESILKQLSNEPRGDSPQHRYQNSVGALRYSDSDMKRQRLGQKKCGALPCSVSVDCFHSVLIHKA